MAKKPKDLITIKEASKMSAKSLSSVRAWVRAKKITGYKQNPKHRNSPLLVSESELRTYLAVNGKITAPNVGRDQDQSVSLREKDKLIEELKDKIQVLEITVQTNNHLVITKDELIDNLKSQVKDGKELLNRALSDNERLSELYNASNQKYTELSEEYRQLSTWAALPFWQRWTKSPLLLDDKSKNK